MILFNNDDDTYKEGFRKIPVKLYIIYIMRIYSITDKSIIAANRRINNQALALKPVIKHFQYFLFRKTESTSRKQ